MSQREINSLAKILSDPQNDSRSAEELAALILEQMYDLAVETAKTETRAETRAETRREIFENDAKDRRLAVVGQISYGPQEETHTVVLGPFRAPLKLTDPERLKEAVKRPCTDARGAGDGLAWDSKTQTGRGRWMLAPAFMRPRDAWDFFRAPKAKAGDPMNLLLPPPEHIAESVERWQPGLWAEEYTAGP